MAEDKNIFIRTIKLEVYPDTHGDTKEERDEKYQHLRNMVREGYQAANRAVTGFFINKSMVNIYCERAGIDVPATLKEQRDIERQIIETLHGKSPDGTLYDDAKREAQYLPTGSLASIANSINSSLKKEWFEILTGQKSLRNYKEGMPIPFRKSDVTIYQNDEGYPRIKLPARKGAPKIELYIKFGKDKSNNRLTINQIISGHKGHGELKLQYNRDKNKWFLYVPVKEEKVEATLDPNTVLGVDLGIKTPVVMALNSHAHFRKSMGDISEFLRVRTQMQARKRRLQSALKLAGGGKGRKKKLKANDQFKEKERNFVKDYNHKMSAQIVETALRQNAGQINMEFLKGFGSDRSKSSDFFLRNWSYFELQSMVEYKAARYGIEVKYVDPYHTSQTCSCCGHYEPGQRVSQANFVCANCGEEMNADYNAAKNIAMSTKYLNKKKGAEQTQYYKEKKKAKKKAEKIEKETAVAV